MAIQFRHVSWCRRPQGNIAVGRGAKKRCSFAKPLLMLLLAVLIVDPVVSEGQVVFSDEVEFLLLQNEASRHKLLTGRYRYSEAMGAGLERPEDAAELRQGNVVFDGVNRFQTRVETQPYFANPGDVNPSFRERETRAVLNESYSAKWSVGDPGAAQVEHDHVDNINPEVAEILQADAGDDFLMLGFGLGGQPLRRDLEDSKSRKQWANDFVVETVASESGERIFVLKGYTQAQDGPVGLRQQYEFNADRGFLMTSASYFDVEGQVIMQETVEVQDATGNGDWAPVSMTQENRRHIDQGGEFDLDFYRRIEIEFEAVNEPVPPEVFTINSLGLPEGHLVAHTSVSGEKSTRVVVGGTPLPQQIALQLLRLPGVAAPWGRISNND